MPQRSRRIEGAGSDMDLSDKTLAIIGLGYVGLPLAGECGRRGGVIGSDSNPWGAADPQSGQDPALEGGRRELRERKYVLYSATRPDLRRAQVFTVPGPPPVAQASRPDMTPLVKASET